MKQSNKPKGGFGILKLLGIFLLAFLAFCLVFGDDEEEVSSNPRSETSSLAETDSASTGEATSGTTTSTATTVSELSAVRSRLTEVSSAETVTVMIYMNGSNLESEDGAATVDIQEMLAAPYSDNVHIVVQTMGTKSWKSTYGISSTHTQRWLLGESALTLVDDSLEQLDCTESGTLADFITWSAENYPADRYILVLWDHGGGPVYGFGYDEWVADEDATLTLDELQQALSTAGVTFDFIGMDACIMSCLEVCCALYDYCDYMVLSEEFEPGTGWAYAGWLTALAEDPSIDTVELATILIDDMIDVNSGSDGDSATLALLDESVMPVLFAAWTEFAYANESSLLGSNYSQKVLKSSRARGFFSDWLYDDEDDYSLSDYYITDIMAVAQNIDSDESAALSSAVSSAVVYFGATNDITSLTGLSVTLPYGDSDFYQTLSTIFSNCGFDSTYVEWLSGFTSAESSSYYSYDDEWEDWLGWDDYEDDYDWDDWDSDWDDLNLFGWIDWDDWFDSDDDWYEDDWFEYDWDEDDWDDWEDWEDDWW